jgi:hypothetical protein
MKVKLTKDIFEHDYQGKNVGLKVSMHRGKAVPFVEGAIIDCSEATGAKFIERGQAVACEPEVVAEPEVANTDE